MNFASLLTQQAAVRPHAEALVGEGRRWTFANADREVRCLASGLRRRGIGTGARVAVVASNRPEYVLLSMAVNHVGGVIVPLNFRLTEWELRDLLLRSGSIAVGTERAFLPTVDSAAATVPTIVLRVGLDDDDAHGWTPYASIASEIGDDLLAPLDGSALQRIMFTSGTTSAPKGALVTHAMAASNAHTQVVALDVRPGDRILITAPLHHVGGADLPGLAAWLQGAAIVLQSRFDAEETLRLLVDERITGTTMVQTMLHLLRHRAGGQTPQDLALRWVLFGSLPLEVCREVADVLPGVRLIRGYGMTETMGGVCYLPDVASAPSELAVTCGWPVPFADVRTVDEEGRPTPVKVEGEIAVRGDKVTTGYLMDDGVIEPARIDDWLRTGDVGVIGADGSLRVTDRLKDMIRSGGENIASAEIEQVLYRHPGIGEAAVVGVPHERWVEVPKAFVVPRPSTILTDAEILGHCRRHLAGFKIPAFVEVVDELPRTASGKVVKRALRMRQSGGEEPRHDGTG